MAKKDPFRNPRTPRPKGAQVDQGCLMALAMLPALPVLALVRRRGPNAQCGCCGCRKWMCGCSCCCGR
jgi:hypothetical protein